MVGGGVKTFLTASRGCWIGGKKEAIGERQPIISGGVSGQFVVYKREVREIFLQFDACCSSPSDASLEGLFKVSGFDGLVVPGTPAKSTGLLEVLVFEGDYTPLYIHALAVGFGALVVSVLPLLLAIMADMGDGFLHIGDWGQGGAWVFCVEHRGLVVGALQVSSHVISIR